LGFAGLLSGCGLARSHYAGWVKERRPRRSRSDRRKTHAWWLIWTIVGILLIIALLIYIF
jgi:hypothetical protein